MTDTSAGSRQLSCPDCGRQVQPAAEICACGFPLMFLESGEQQQRTSAPTRRPGDDDDTGPIPVVSDVPREGPRVVAPDPLPGDGLVCSQCGEVNAADRTWCARDGAALRPLTGSTEVLPVTPAPARSPGRRPVLVVLLGVLLFAAIGGAVAGWYLWPEDEAGPVQTEPEESPAVQTPSGEPGPLPIAGASASDTGPDSQDRAGSTVSYGAENLVDGDLSTAWRVRHSPEDPVLRFALESGPREVTAVGLVPGYAKVDPLDGEDRFRQNRRVTLVEWQFDDGRTVLQPIPDPDPEMTMLELPEPVTTSTVVAVVRGSTEPGGGARFDNTAVSEVRVVGR